MPRVWIVPESDRISVVLEEVPDGMPVEMSASVLRQINAANKQYEKFQNLLAKFYLQAMQTPNTVRRVR